MSLLKLIVVSLLLGFLIPLPVVADNSNEKNKEEASRHFMRAEALFDAEEYSESA